MNSNRFKSDFLKLYPKFHSSFLQNKIFGTTKIIKTTEQSNKNPQNKASLQTFSYQIFKALLA